MSTSAQRLAAAGFVTACAAATVGLGTGPAAAADAPQPTAAFVGGLVAKGDTAHLQLRYTCTSTVSPGTHLYAAVKQGPTVSPQNTSSTSGGVDSYHSTNGQSDSGANALRCDGKQHTQRLVLRSETGFSTLTTGTVLVQLCVYDNITGVDGFEPVGGFAFDYSMQRLQAAAAG